MMRIASENGLLVDPNSGHCPPENKASRRRKQQKRTQVQSTDVQALPVMTSTIFQQQNCSNSSFSLEHQIEQTHRHQVWIRWLQPSRQHRRSQASFPVVCTWCTEFKSHDNISTKMVSDHKSSNGAANYRRAFASCYFFQRFFVTILQWLQYELVTLTDSVKKCYERVFMTSLQIKKLCLTAIARCEV